MKHPNEHQAQEAMDLLKLYAGITGKVLGLINGGYQNGFFEGSKNISGNAWITVEELLETWNRVFSSYYREITLEELCIILESNKNWFRSSLYNDGRWRAVCSMLLGDENNLPAA